MNDKNETRNGLTFSNWLDKVDRILIQKIGLTQQDLDDFNSYDAWDSEMTPEEGAFECMSGDDLYAGALDEFDFD
jgi:hypothetical protein